MHFLNHYDGPKLLNILVPAIDENIQKIELLHNVNEVENLDNHCGDNLSKFSIFRS